MIGSCLVDAGSGMRELEIYCCVYI